jgi:hypothetical protein
MIAMKYGRKSIENFTGSSLAMQCAATKALALYDDIVERGRPSNMILPIDREMAPRSGTDFRSG